MVYRRFYFRARLRTFPPVTILLVVTHPSSDLVSGRGTGTRPPLSAARFSLIIDVFLSFARFLFYVNEWCSTPESMILRIFL